MKNYICQRNGCNREGEYRPDWELYLCARHLQGRRLTTRTHYYKAAPQMRVEALGPETGEHGSVHDGFKGHTKLRPHDNWRTRDKEPPSVRYSPEDFLRRFGLSK